MDPGAGHNSATRTHGVPAPGSACLIWPRRQRPFGFCAEDWAKTPFDHESARLKVQRMMAKMISGAEANACLLTGSNHLARVFNRRREGLFAQHVLAGSGAGKDVFVVEVVRRGDPDCVDA